MARSNSTGERWAIRTAMVAPTATSMEAREFVIDLDTMDAQFEGGRRSAENAPSVERKQVTVSCWFRRSERNARDHSFRLVFRLVF